MQTFQSQVPLHPARNDCLKGAPPPPSSSGVTAAWVLIGQPLSPIHPSQIQGGREGYSGAQLQRECTGWYGGVCPLQSEGRPPSGGAALFFPPRARGRGKDGVVAVAQKEACVPPSKVGWYVVRIHHPTVQTPLLAMGDYGSQYLHRGGSSHGRLSPTEPGPPRGPTPSPTPPRGGWSASGVPQRTGVTMAQAESWILLPPPGPSRPPPVCVKLPPPGTCPLAS